MKIIFRLGSLTDLWSIMVVWWQILCKYLWYSILYTNSDKTDYKIKTNFTPFPRGQIALQLEKRYTRYQRCTNGTNVPKYWLHLCLNSDKDVEIDFDASIDVKWESNNGETMEPPTSDNHSFLLCPTPPGSATLDITVRVTNWVITEKQSLKRPHSEHSN